MASFEAADWRMRTPGWGDLRELKAEPPVPYVEFAPWIADDARGEWDRLRRAWRAMPRHPTAIELLDVDGDIARLRYPAIDWEISSGDGKILTAAGKFLEQSAVSTSADVVHLYRHIIAHVPQDDWVWFANPAVVFDLRRRPRVVWCPISPATPKAPGVEKAWPRIGEKELVQVVGWVMRELGLATIPMARIALDACLEIDRDTPTFAELAANLRGVLRTAEPTISRVWDLTEEGIGWFELDQLAFAGERFRQASELEPTNELVKQGRAMTDGTATVESAKRLEAEGWWVEAIAAYRHVRTLMERADYLAAIARCELARGERARSMEVAKRAMAIAPDNVAVVMAYVEAAMSWGYTRNPAAAIGRVIAGAPELIEQVGKIIDLAYQKSRFDEVIACVQMLLADAGNDLDRLDRYEPVIERALVAVRPASAIAIADSLDRLSSVHGARALRRLVDRWADNPTDDFRAICARLFERSVEDGIAAYARMIEARFRNRQFADGLAIADQLIELAPESGLARYRRARCLFGLGRLFEARAELDRAQALAPMLVEAMVVRREVDRAIGKIKDAAGTANPQQLSVPPHLGEVRIAMSKGKIDEAVRLLREHDPSDEAAQLLLGQLLMATKPDEAVAAFDRVTGELVHRARVGKAKALALQDRIEEALRLLDRVCAEEPRLGDAMRARTALLSARELVTIGSARS